jgi:hypothetical protein
MYRPFLLLHRNFRSSCFLLDVLVVASAMAFVVAKALAPHKDPLPGHARASPAYRVSRMKGTRQRRQLLNLESWNLRQRQSPVFSFLQLTVSH